MGKAIWHSSGRVARDSQAPRGEGRGKFGSEEGYREGKLGKGGLCDLKYCS